MNPPDGLLDDAVDRALALLIEPVLVRRALAELGSPSRSMTCSIMRDAAPWSGSGWQAGSAVIRSQLLVFRSTGSGDEVRLDVRAVVDTREVRRRPEGQPGPRRLGVIRLDTDQGVVWCSAHRRVLAAATAVLRGRFRPAPPGSDHGGTG